MDELRTYFADWMEPGDDHREKGVILGYIRTQTRGEDEKPA